VPPLSLHGMPAGASTNMHTCAVGLHRLATQALVVAGQSVGSEQPATHDPPPSHRPPAMSTAAPGHAVPSGMQAP